MAAPEEAQTEAVPHTDRARVRLCHAMTLPFPLERVFPLLCPVAERDWVPGWDPKIVYTESGLAERGCVFQTDKPGEGVDTWVVSNFEPPRRISFVRVDAVRAVLYDVELTDSGDGSGAATELHWRQEITALDEAGDEAVRAMTQADFERMIESLEAMAAHFLHTGERLDS